MRRNILNIHSTKSERIFHECLKELKIPFRHRWLIHGREVDFLLWDRVVIEIDGHPQDGLKNHFLADLGYLPIHLNNNECTKENIHSLINKLHVNIKLS